MLTLDRPDLPTIGRHAAIIDNGVVTERRELRPDETDVEALAALTGKAPTIWVVHVEHEHGSESWAAQTETIAWDILRDYIAEYACQATTDPEDLLPDWVDDDGEFVVPEDPREAAEGYYEVLEPGESFSILETTVHQ